MQEIRVLSATGMLGSGFKPATLKAALDRSPHFIGVDSGSTDPGPFYLGSGESMFSEQAYKRDLRLLLIARGQLKIPLIIGSACTAGAKPHLEQLKRLVLEIASEEKLSFKLAIIHSDQDKNYLVHRLREGKIRALENAPALTESVIHQSVHIVGMAGVEPFIEALDQGADVVIAGRASDTSIFAALPYKEGIPAGIAWHAAKVLECGAACVTHRKYPDCNFAYLRSDHFVIDPPNPDYRCDPESVASHNLYENASPYELIEPGGILDTYDCSYEAISDRAVKVSGSRFKPVDEYTIKLEGSALAGYQTIILGTIRDPVILMQLDSWLKNLLEACEERIAAIYSDEIKEKYKMQVKIIGKDSTMGE
ncbi:MAG: acyclic terpene utilization AtuA family protein, partial [Proteobacteria bacterium]|nr:acyclic terpene utilization AtuA family protein [Pseudomonadota bacterium]